MTGRAGTRAATALAMALGLGLAPCPGHAQAYQCSLPRNLAPLTPSAPDGPIRKVPVAAYTLAASWSPDYCKTHGDTGSMQCSGSAGRFGFVLHGLWPEARRGPPPQWCAGTVAPPPPGLLRRHPCMTPSAALLAHEWAKHGTCMARRPETYFKVGAILWRSIRWPDADRLSRRPGLVAGDLRNEFLALNRGWTRESIGLGTGRSGWLREVRLCYGADFRPTRCSSAQFGPGDDAALKIWRGI